MKITSEQLHQLIKESVKEVIHEMYHDDDERGYDKSDDDLQYMYLDIGV